MEDVDLALVAIDQPFRGVDQRGRALFGLTGLRLREGGAYEKAEKEGGGAHHGLAGFFSPLLGEVSKMTMRMFPSTVA